MWRKSGGKEKGREEAEKEKKKNEKGKGAERVSKVALGFLSSSLWMTLSI